jgi:hypothetical protein
MRGGTREMRAMLMLMMVVVLLFGLCSAACAADAAPGRKGPYATWSRGPSAAQGFFPIGVCTQDPARAKEYRELGINTYLSIWDGPSDEQMQQLHEAGMTAMCEPDDWGGKAWAHREDPAITGWIQVDEPDNAQREDGGGYGKAIPPEKIMAVYEDLRKRDPTRPVVLCLGQGVANDEWVGRGCEMSDYPKYAQACDILMYDVYPVVGIRKPDGENYLWYVAKGLDRLREWSGGKKIIWNAIECTHINNPDQKATPHQVKAEVWMSLIHGSMGIMYFVHQFKPTFVEAGLLIDPEMMAAVKSINQQILSLAPVLNSPTVEGVVGVTSTSREVPIDVMAKRQGEATYVFSVAMRNAKTRGTFEVKGLPAKAVAEVLGEDRTVAVSHGKFEDEFRPYDVHLYKLYKIVGR